MAKTKGGAMAKRGGKRPARKAAAKKAPTRRTRSRKPAPRKSAAGKLAVKAKVPKAKAKAIIADFRGTSVDVAPGSGTTGATLTMLQASPTKAGTD